MISKINRFKEITISNFNKILIKILQLPPTSHESSGGSEQNWRVEKQKEK